MKMKSAYLASFLIILSLISTCIGKDCYKLTSKSDTISRSDDFYYSSYNCWSIDVPKNTYLHMKFEQRSNINKICSESYVNITVAETEEVYKLCFTTGKSSGSAIALNTVQVNLKITSDRRGNPASSFFLSYNIEDLLCTKENSFRCSNHSCIHQSKVCNGVEDCENGSDEMNCMTEVKGVNDSRETTVTWLKNQRSASFGWDKNTHRAITALYLADEFSFRGQNLEEELSAKQLELEISLALLRNSTDLLSVNELSMFVDALTVTCHDPRQFYGENLVKILAERVSLMESPSPRAYLTLCNSNWTLTESDVGNLLKLLQKQSKYPFLLDVQAVTVMALACVRNRRKELPIMAHAAEIYNETVTNIIAGQHPDGSFGNVYTTAVVTQALIASNKLQVVKRWNMISTMEYLMKQLNSSKDFLSAYFALPIFRGKSLTDLQTVNCTNVRKQGGDDISDITSKFGPKKRIQLSLYVGDRKDVIHTVYLRMPENSSAYDVLRMAQALDPKYKFFQRDVSGHMYVYKIAGITNDPEAGQYWLLYTGDNDVNGEVVHHLESPERFFLGDADHLIMWFKTADI